MSTFQLIKNILYTTGHVNPFLVPRSQLSNTITITQPKEINSSPRHTYIYIHIWGSETNSITNKHRIPYIRDGPPVHLKIKGKIVTDLQERS